MNKKILLTGSSGFLGKNLQAYLVNNLELSVIRCVRNNASDSDNVLINNINSVTEWSRALSNVDCVVHLAAIAHGKNNSLDINSEFKEVNTLGSLRLAEQAAVAGVRRFVYISSIGVNGLSTERPFLYSDLASPQEPYAVSKSEAEDGLRKIAEETGMEVVIIRPPLVYGANAPGNFGKLSALAKKNLPLPLGAIKNKRSLVGIDNLVDLISTCIDHPKAANQTFLVSDDHDVSTSVLLKSMIIAAGKKSRLIPIPVGVLRFLAGLLGKESVIDRMSSSLQVDITYTKETLGWKPPVSFEEGIRRCFK